MMRLLFNESRKHWSYCKYRNKFGQLGIRNRIEYSNLIKFSVQVNMQSNLIKFSLQLNIPSNLIKFSLQVNMQSNLIKFSLQLNILLSTEFINQPQLSCILLTLL
jgi:hypothetical protein